MSLVELLQTVPEFRHLRGKRHQLWFILLMMIVGAMCGYWGYRPLAEFTQLYGAQVCQHLECALPQRLPSYSTFRRIILELDFQAFAQVFNQWAQQYVPIEPGEWLAVDGKSIKGSVSNYDNDQQNFVMLVSVFSHKRGFVLHSQPMENKAISELHVVQQLLGALDLSGAVVTADALHTQKNSGVLAPAGGSLSAVCEGEPSQVIWLDGGLRSNPSSHRSR